MTRSAKRIFALLLAVSPAIHAQDGLLTYPLSEADRYQWRPVHADLPPWEYREALHHNRRLAREALRETLVSIGVPKVGVKLVGAAVALAVDDLSIPLNRSKTLALQIENAAGGDRSALLRVKFDW